jgi:hypothetical protein
VEEDTRTANLIAISRNHNDQGDDDAPVVELKRFLLDPSRPYSPCHGHNIKEDEDCLDDDEFRASRVSADGNYSHVGRYAGRFAGWVNERCVVFKFSIPRFLSCRRSQYIIQERCCRLIERRLVSAMNRIPFTNNPWKILYVRLHTGHKPSHNLG